MKIVIDNKIPFVGGLFEPFAEVVYLPGAAITAADVRWADALVVRTRTICNGALLHGAERLRIVATATIGYDHIDTAYCADRGIRVATAAGCNARAVAQWVFASLAEMGVDPTTRRVALGVVGVGNVGRAVVSVARGAGFDVLCCDPPRALREGTDGFVSLDQLLAESDIVTLHLPLDSTTRGLARSRFFGQIKPHCTFLNSSRGEVVDQNALKKALRQSRVSRCALDVWADEPNIDVELLSMVNIATPHIAGYSLQGKAMGSAMAVRAVARELSIDAIHDHWYPDSVTPVTPVDNMTWNEIAARMSRYYDVMADDNALRMAPTDFERLREGYKFRNEFF